MADRVNGMWRIYDRSREPVVIVFRGKRIETLRQLNQLNMLEYEERYG